MALQQPYNQIPRKRPIEEVLLLAGLGSVD